MIPDGVMSMFVRLAILVVMSSKMPTLIAAPLPDTHEAVKHRRVLLQMCLGNRSPVEAGRLEKLDFWANGDPRSDVVEHFGSSSEDTIITEIIQALLPRALPVFPRHRWLTSADAMKEAALLCGFHRLLERAEV